LIDSPNQPASTSLYQPRPASFPRDSRLLKPEEFERVFKENERARSDSLLVMVRPNALGQARLGMIVAKRLLPRAVDRNRVKRCVRETFRRQRHNLPACDFVVRLISKPVAGKEISDLARALTRAGQRALSKWPPPPLTE
jgi:ribonuclease P protein component